MDPTVCALRPDPQDAPSLGNIERCSALQIFRKFNHSRTVSTTKERKMSFGSPEELDALRQQLRARTASGDALRASLGLVLDVFDMWKSDNGKASGPATVHGRPIRYDVPGRNYEVATLRDVTSTRRELDTK